ncbi:aspartate/glutamate racemase family protein [Leptolyngbya sp. FACHB-711]|uniref:aspartate/glutamate racemase family protein n=1 Tax=Leptolyngbya sp. FACHB-711 TaxID=2692813 RepID=UPI001688F298|nr:aspartate/glutamate racemase family protein [Leptolyngbya sp. FACHB-711]MBD1851238.1 aspartate/glutamate racemase family protein [Cyanobacteria bacterium FACHB-502]MBD2027612.1 aspartate/glutamate racemase family protein [Leptolyngbya sp. FACHB-711]
MRIKVINGNTFEPMTRGIDESAQAVRSPQTEIITTQPKAGPESIEGYYDEYLAIPGILEEVILSGDEIDAFVIACWGDPGVEAARELTTKPVVGIAEASMYVANMVAARWGVVTTMHRALDMIEKTIHRAGFSHRCVSIRTTGLSVIETETARQATIAALETAGRLAITEDKAEALCLGCAGMSGLDKALEERLEIPIIDAVAAAVKMAEAIVGLQKQTSKALTYQRPESKRIKGFPDYMQF